MPIPDGLVGERADAAVARLLGFSRTFAQEVLEAGGVSLDGVVLGKSDRMRPGWLDVEWMPKLEPAVVPQLVPGFHVVHDDDDLVVIDKPHFLPTTPGGRFLRESALVRLRIRLDNPDLTPIHRLDRATAGLVMFSARPATRGAFQSLFEKRRVTKVYEAVSAAPAEWNPQEPALAGRPLPLVYRTHIQAHRGRLRVDVDDSREPNSETSIELRAAGLSPAGRRVLHTTLTPHTGRMHQLRVHLAALGAGILGDTWYPDLLPERPDDHTLPLQLLARELQFTDPLSEAPRRFRTRRTLSEAPVGDI